MLRFFFLIVIAVLIASCRSEQGIEPINSQFLLSEDQVSQYTDKAMHGDSAAAIRLYRYYYYGHYDVHAAVKWLSVSATNSNNKYEEYLLGQFYSGDFKPDLIDTNLALYWFNRAASGGETNAIARLKELGYLQTTNKLNSTHQP